MKINESKKSTMAIGILALVLFAMVCIASASDVVGKQPSPAEPSATNIKAGATSLSVVGNWNLYYDWSGSGTSYTSTGMTFKSGGTFTIPSWGYTGKWTQSTDNGMIIFKIDQSGSFYSGNVAGKTMTGIMSKFDGSNGVWYAIKQ